MANTTAISRWTTIHSHKKFNQFLLASCLMPPQNYIKIRSYFSKSNQAEKIDCPESISSFIASFWRRLQMLRYQQCYH